MNRGLCAYTAAAMCLAFAPPSTAQDGFTLSSPEISDGGTLPVALKCTRDGGDGVSPPLAWAGAPAGTQSFAVIMHHYPRGTVAGRDAPSQYWLLWNIPSDTREIARGNPSSIGDEGADKDERQTGYTPPCSPPGARHQYTITVYALDSALSELPMNNDISVDWETLTTAIEGKVLATSHFSFDN